MLTADAARRSPRQPDSTGPLLLVLTVEGQPRRPQGPPAGCCPPPARRIRAAREREGRSILTGRVATRRGLRQIVQAGCPAFGAPQPGRGTQAAPSLQPAHVGFSFPLTLCLQGGADEVGAGGGQLPLLLLVAEAPQCRRRLQELLGGVAAAAIGLAGRVPVGGRLVGLESRQVPAAALPRLAMAGLHPPRAAGGGGAPVGAGWDSDLHHGRIHFGDDYLRLEEVWPGGVERSFGETTVRHQADEYSFIRFRHQTLMK